LTAGNGALGEWALCVWILDSFWCSRFPALSADVFQRLDGALQQFLEDSHIGRLVCWQRRMDSAFCPRESDCPQSTLPKALEPIFDPCALQNQLLEGAFAGDFVFPLAGQVPLCKINDVQLS